MEKCTTRLAGEAIVGATILMPATAWASEGAPDANLFGLVVTALIVIAAGVGAWVSIRDVETRRSKGAQPSKKSITNCRVDVIGRDIGTR